MRQLSVNALREPIEHRFMDFCTQFGSKIYGFGSMMFFGDFVQISYKSCADFCEVFNPN
jgi:hypothetical protein